MRYVGISLCNQTKSTAGAAEGSQGQARSAQPLDPLRMLTEPWKGDRKRSVFYRYRPYRAREVYLFDPGAARSALAPGYLLPPLRGLISSFMLQSKNLREDKKHGSQRV